MRKMLFFNIENWAITICLIISLTSSAYTKAGMSNQSFPQKEINGETKINQITKGNFLIVGSFLYLKNAQNYANYLNKSSYSANMGFYPGNKHYYVYLSQSANLEELRGRRDIVREMDEFKDAWILVIGDTQARAIKGNSNSEVVIHEAKTEAPLESETTNSAAKETTADEAPVKETVKEARPGYKNYSVYLNVVSATTLKEVPASIQLINVDEMQLQGVLESHKTQTIEVPVDGSHDIQLICEVFGYKKVQQDLNLKLPVNETNKNSVSMVKDTIVVNFELVRYKKGELFTMFNVFFYNDAAVMLPKSIYELNSLVQMVQENPNLKIKLHGHTNGNDYGRIIKLGPNDNDYFNLKPSNIHTKGSAKDLSYARSEVIRRYLMEQGIEEDRIDFKGWGGSRPLYPIKSPDAKKNVRVEIEILKD